MPHWRFMGYCFKLLNVFTTSGSKPLISIYICYLWQCFFPLFLMPVCYCCLWEYSAVSLLPFQKCHITSLCLYPHQKYKNWIWQPYSGCHIQKKKKQPYLRWAKKTKYSSSLFWFARECGTLDRINGCGDTRRRIGWLVYRLSCAQVFKREIIRYGEARFVPLYNCSAVLQKYDKTEI